MKRENRIEVPGTPEQVWEAIATGHGIETWFVPAEIEGRVGGKVRLDMGTGMADAGVVTGWDPPHRFAYDEQWEGEVEGTLATEFLVEAQSGGTCIVRLVSTVHATGGDWTDMLENLRRGLERLPADPQDLPRALRGPAVPDGDGRALRSGRRPRRRPTPRSPRRGRAR